LIKNVVVCLFDDESIDFDLMILMFSFLFFLCFLMIDDEFFFDLQMNE